MKRVLVVGAAGRIGSCVARRLALENMPLRLMLRSAVALNAMPDCEVMLGDYNDAERMREVFQSVERVFMYAPDARASTAVFGAASAAGVRHVVLLSSASVTKVPPGTNPIAERHRLAEQAVKEAGLDWTFIRPDTLASNCLQWVPTILAERRVYAPYPLAMRNPIHEDDVSKLIVRSLSDPHFLRSEFDVTGPELISIAGQVEAIAALLGTPVSCVQIPEEEAIRRMAQLNPPVSEQAAVRLLEYLRKSVSAPPTITDGYQRAMGYAPRPFEDWVRDNIGSFKSRDGSQ